MNGNDKIEGSAKFLFGQILARLDSIDASQIAQDKKLGELFKWLESLPCKVHAECLDNLEGLQKDKSVSSKISLFQSIGFKNGLIIAVIAAIISVAVSLIFVNLG